MPIESTKVNVFSSSNKIKPPKLKPPKGLRLNSRNKMDGIEFLKKLDIDSIPVAFFDPQYRGVLDKLKYGNEGKKRGAARCSLKQMNDEIIQSFIVGIDKTLIPSGHLFLWMDKFHLCTGFAKWLDDTKLDVVDMLVWDKGKMGMGYRTRRRSEYLVILQKHPRKAKGVWKIHTIPDIWQEKVQKNGHAHTKPVELQGELIAAVSHEGDVVIDPAAGSYSVMKACKLHDRNFLGCDVNG